MKSFGKKILLATGVMLVTANGSIVLADERTITDIMPPTGSIQILTDTTQGVDAVDIKINATDKTYQVDSNGNISVASVTNNMMYDVSTKPFSDDKNEPQWKTYVPNATINVAFDSTADKGRVYAILKDTAGNTTKVYSGTSAEYTVVFNSNAYGVTNMPESSHADEMNGMYGRAYALSNTYPRKSGAFFLGWSTDPYASDGSYAPGDIVPASAFSVGETELNLYAIWSREETGLPKLGEVCEPGDYVRYPVYYENASYHDNGSTTPCTYEGWRVLSVDSATNEVTLVSAGVPLGYKLNKAKDDVPQLTNEANFIKIGTSGYKYKFEYNGFAATTTTTTTTTGIAAAFKNSYTKKNGSTPAIHAMCLDDVKEISASMAEKVGDSSLTISDVSRADLTKGGYDNMFSIGSNYWLADRKSGNSAYYVNDAGGLEGAKQTVKGLRIIVTLNGNIYTDGKDIDGYWNLM